MADRRSSSGETTYYIDPVSGSDGRDGRTREGAWRSFAPVNALVLAPGDRVEVIAPGAFPGGLSLTGAGREDAPIRVHLAPGRYEIHRGGPMRRYQISNTNDGVDHEKAVAILVENARHVEIGGPGAEIICRGRMIEVGIDRAEKVTVTDLAFDYHRPTVSEFTVAAVADGRVDLEVHPDSAYRLEDGRMRWVGEGWDYDNGERVLAQQLEIEDEHVWRCPNPLREMRLEELAPGIVRAHGAHEMAVGRVFQLRDPFRDCVGVFLNRSRDIAFRGVAFRFFHGMGLLAQFTENITLASVAIAPGEGSGRTCAAWADCSHFSGCRGRIVVRDCLFSGAQDDAMNVHGTYLRVVAAVAANRIRVRFMHRQTYGFMAFNVGDEIEFVRAETLASFAANRVTASEMLDDHELLLTLERPAPGDLRGDDVIENVTWTPEVELTGCSIRRIPTRGLLLTTRRSVRVSDNEFVRPHRNGIHVSGDARSWFESGCVRDMTIRANRFFRCGREAICIAPENSAPNDAFHRGIRIVGNEFILGDGICLDAKSAAGLEVEGNTIRADRPVEEDEIFRITDCAGTRIEGNSIVGEEA